jgi:hypothetical protein
MISTSISFQAFWPENEEAEMKGEAMAPHPGRRTETRRHGSGHASPSKEWKTTHHFSDEIDRSRGRESVTAGCQS